MKKPQQKRYALATVLCLSCFMMTMTSMASPIKIGRYLTVPAGAAHHQTHLLAQRLQLRFPQNVVTIQQAIVFMLQFSGYRLADIKQMGQTVKRFLQQPLPEVDRLLGPMTLQQGLITLAGNAFYVLIDPVHRLVSYALKSCYQPLYQQHVFTKNT